MKNTTRIPLPLERIAIGNRIWHVQKMGHGSPTVIFESGLGGLSLQWFQIQSQIAELTTTLSYDRAGQGQSDPPQSPRTPQNITDELSQLLVQLQVQPPYILVGHSFGGLLCRYFANQYPETVKGIVLVDASHEKQLELIEGYDKRHSQMLKGMRLMSELSRLPVLGRMIANRSLKDFQAHVTEDMWQKMVVIAGSPKHLKSMYAEMSHFEDFFGQKHIIPDDFGDLPLIVVTAAESVLHNPPADNLSAEAFNHAHLEMQATLSEMSTRGQHIIVPKATHMSIMSHPAHAQYVTNAICQLLGM